MKLPQYCKSAIHPGFVRKTVVPVLLVAFSTVQPASALTVNFVSTIQTDTNASDYDAGETALQAGDAAYDGFRAAADIWEGLLTDDVTLKMNIRSYDFGSAYIIGSASTTSVGRHYYNPGDEANSVASALQADATTMFDQAAVANLQMDGGNYTQTLDFWSNGADGSGNVNTGVRFLNDHDEAYNAVLNITQANAKALGLFSAHDTNTVDANISFNSTVNFDYDSTTNSGGSNDSNGDGIIDNHIDFVGAALHEIGHALGFVSGVDDIDYLGNLGNFPFAARTSDQDHFGAENYRIGTVLDLYRYSDQSIVDGVLDWAVGNDAQGNRPFFSIDGGLTDIATFATGSYNGDGQQASHWQGNQGLMDPTTDLGMLMTISNNDLLGLDVIGWDVAVAQAPLPGTLILLGSGLLFIRRRKNVS